MARHFVFYGDACECNKLIGEAILLCHDIDSIGTSYPIVKEFYIDNTKHIRIEKRTSDYYQVHIFASASSYYMKSGLVRSGKTVISDGKYIAKDFLPSSVMFKKEHDQWKASGSTSNEPTRKYRNEGGFSFCSEGNIFDVANPVPSKFTGLMHGALELALGSGRIISVSNSFYATHGIVRYGDTDWLVEIGQGRNIARRINRLEADLFGDTWKDLILATKLGYVPEDLYIPLGDKYNKEFDEGRIIKLSGDFPVRECYQNGWTMDRSGQTGWSFNDNGTSCCNVFMKAHTASNSSYNQARVIKVDIEFKTIKGVVSASITKTQVSTNDCDTSHLVNLGGPLFMYSGMPDNFALLETMPTTSDNDMYCDTGTAFSGFLENPMSGGSAPGTVMAKQSNEFPVWCGYVNNSLSVVKFGYEKHDGYVQTDPAETAYTSTPNGDTPCWSFRGVGGGDAFNKPRYIRGISSYTKRYISINGNKHYEFSGSNAGGNTTFLPGYYMDSGSVDSDLFCLQYIGYPMYAFTGWGYKSVLASGAENVSYSEGVMPKKNADCALTFSASPTDRCSFVVRGCQTKKTHSAYSDQYYGVYSYCYRLSSGVFRYFSWWRECGCSDNANYNYPIGINTSYDNYIQQGRGGSYGGALHDYSNDSCYVHISGGCCQQGTTYTPEYGSGTFDDYFILAAQLYAGPNTFIHWSPERNRYEGSNEYASNVKIIAPDHTTNQYEENYTPGEDVFSVNGVEHVIPCTNNQQVVSVWVPSLNKYFRYQDGSLFYSFRSSSITKPSLIAFNPNLANGNTLDNDTRMFVKEESMDNEVFVNWYTDPNYADYFGGKNRFSFPYLNHGSSAINTNESVYRQFFGPYVWVGVQ